MSERRCGGCAHFNHLRENLEPDIGECRRYPPSTENAELGAVTYWPLVDRGEHWCGEWCPPGENQR